MANLQACRSLKAALREWPFLLIVVFLFSSCGSNQVIKSSSVEIVAEVGQHYLTSDELERVFGDNWRTKKEDVKDFIRIWAKDKVIGIIAEEKLDDSDKDFQREVNSYKNSLLKYTFENKMLDTALSLDVKEEDLSRYLLNNQKNFQLKENIVRVRYVKILKKHSKLNQIKYMIQYKDSSRKEKFFNLIQKENIFCEANDSAWYKLDDLKKLIPFKLYNDEHFLRHYKYTEAPDGDYVWILFFTQNRLKKGASPLEMVRAKIKAIIINQRKQELIQKFEKKLYMDALINKDVKIYVDYE
jgi:hypothetical protein